MQANELRIGNMVWSGGVGIVTDITREGYYDLYDVELQMQRTLIYETICVESLQPIPLGKKWLDRMDIVGNKGMWTIGKIKRKARWITHGINQNPIESPFLRFDGMCDLHYVHQVQNLHFALTNEELSIKEL